jgi:hypothetical protein
MRVDSTVKPLDILEINDDPTCLLSVLLNEHNVTRADITMNLVSQVDSIET